MPEMIPTSPLSPVPASVVASRVYDVYHVYMALPRPLCTRIPPELEAELESRFADLEWSPSEGLRAVVREWLILGRFSHIEFRDTALGRRAALRGGPEVWEVVAVADGDPSRALAHFNWVPGESVSEALAYAEEHPAEIRRIIDRNRRLAGGRDT